MFKLIVLFAVISLAASAPSGALVPIAYSAPIAHAAIIQPHAAIIQPHAAIVHPYASIISHPAVLHTPYIAPASISSHSSTVIHGSHPVVAPIVAA